ncbi:MAG: hypothetical protein GY757_08770 [bacterium]|nr:hypothetical protein [bacterium]
MKQDVKKCQCQVAHDLYGNGRTGIIQTVEEHEKDRQMFKGMLILISIGVVVDVIEMLAGLFT